MVSEDMEDRIADAFSEVSARSKEFLANHDPVLDQEINPFHKHAAKKAKEYEGKRITAFDMSCVDCDTGKVIDISLGFRDITLQLFESMLYYKDSPIRPCFIKELVDEGTYLKLVRDDQKEIVLYQEDHGEFSITYDQMAITKAMNK